eukprot:jgi/Mesvir1/3178/Mv16336-RA.1
MDVKSHTGIQRLLNAEQEAQRITNAARQSKAARLRQAKEEAEQEVALYRAQREKDFQKKLSESSGHSGTSNKRLEAETQAAIQAIMMDVQRNGAKVSKYLVDTVTKV